LLITCHWFADIKVLGGEGYEDWIREMGGCTDVGYISKDGMDRGCRD
jgi:hypothetical protein